MLGLMLRAKKILDDNDLFFWLDGGTLLWAYRDGTPDESDTDFGIFAKDREKALKIVEKFLEDGWKLHKVFENDKFGVVEISFTNGKKVDLFIKFIDGNKAFHIATDIKEDGSGVDSIPYVQPSKHFKKFDKLTMGGVEWNIPCDTEEYLTTYYGDWREHVTEWDWRTSSPCIQKWETLQF